MNEDAAMDPKTLIESVKALLDRHELQVKEKEAWIKALWNICDVVERHCPGPWGSTNRSGTVTDRPTTDPDSASKTIVEVLEGLINGRKNALARAINFPPASSGWNDLVEVVRKMSQLERVVALRLEDAGLTDGTPPANRDAIVPLLDRLVADRNRLSDLASEARRERDTCTSLVHDLQARLLEVAAAVDLGDQAKSDCQAGRNPWPTIVRVVQGRVRSWDSMREDRDKAWEERDRAKKEEADLRRKLDAAETVLAALAVKTREQAFKEHNSFVNDLAGLLCADPCEESVLDRARTLGADLKVARQALDQARQEAREWSKIRDEERQQFGRALGLEAIVVHGVQTVHTLGELTRQAETLKNAWRRLADTKMAMKLAFDVANGVGEKG